MKKTFLIILIGVFAIAIRVYLLDVLPGEWFGDISNVHEYTQQILTGQWPFYFFQSPGPLYHYLITPLASVWPNGGYELYKTASVIVSLIGILSVGFFVHEVAGTKKSLLTMMVTSYSFWFLIWSRLGNSQIVIPSLVSLLLAFLTRYFKGQKLLDLVIAVSVASLGWYTYPHTFVLPLIVIASLCGFYFFTKKILWKHFPLAIFCLLGFMIPFVHIVRSQPDNFGSSGYVGSKLLPMFAQSPITLGQVVLTNFSKTIKMFHFKGDHVFRINVSDHSQLDLISGVFLILGVVALFKQSKKKLGFLLVCFLILILPSISPSILASEIPNANRTIGVIPVIYYLIVEGVMIVSAKRLVVRALLISVLVVGVWNNLELYFVQYAYGLPEHNLAPSRSFVSVIDTFPSKYSLYFQSCCWAAYGEPEPKGIYYSLHKKRDAEVNTLISDCDQIVKRPALIVLNLSTPKTVELDCIKKVQDVLAPNGEKVGSLGVVE